MQNVNQCHSPCSRQAQNAVYDKLQQSSNFQLAAASSERSADITIRTDDEDVVTLSIDSHVQAAVLTYEEMSKTGSSDREARGKFIGLDVSKEVNLSVDGTLDEQERKEIKQVLKAIFKMVKDFISGKFSQGLERTEKFDDLETIHHVRAEFEAKDTAAYVSQSSSQEVLQVQAPAVRIEQSPSDSKATRPPMAKPVVYPKPMPALSEKPEKAPVEVLADKMTEVVKESGIDPAKIQKPIDKMFGRLMQKFLNEGPFSFRRMRRLSSLMEEFSRKMNQLMNPEKTEAPAIEPLSNETAEPVFPVELFSVTRSTVETHVSFFERSVSFDFQYAKGEQEESVAEEVSAEG